MTPAQIWIAVWIVELTVCCVWAIWRGGPAERAGAAIILCGYIFSAIFQARDGTGPGFWVVANDIVVLGAFAILSLKYRRIWTLLALACQLNAVISHFAQFFTGFGIFSYVTALGIWGGDALVVCVIAGCIGYQRQKRRNERRSLELHS